MCWATCFSFGLLVRRGGDRVSRGLSEGFPLLYAVSGVGFTWACLWTSSTLTAKLWKTVAMERLAGVSGRDDWMQRSPRCWMALGGLLSLCCQCDRILLSLSVAEHPTYSKIAENMAMERLSGVWRAVCAKLPKSQTRDAESKIAWLDVFLTQNEQRHTESPLMLCGRHTDNRREPAAINVWRTGRRRTRIAYTWEFVSASQKDPWNACPHFDSVFLPLKLWQ